LSAFSSIAYSFGTTSARIAASSTFTSDGGLTMKNALNPSGNILYSVIEINNYVRILAGAYKDFLVLFGAEARSLH
jgi:hypothetical protein